MNTSCFIALGSNLNDPFKQLSNAVSAFQIDPLFTVTAVSSFYRNPPAGTSIVQPDYVNAVMEIKTEASPQTLLARLLAQEEIQGRIRPAPEGSPRPLDCDLLLYGQQTLHTPNLQVPHPRMRLRPFVLWPLYEIAPELIFSDGMPLRELVRTLDLSALERLN